MKTNYMRRNSQTKQQFEVGMICHQGRVRTNNQDCILVLEDKGIFLLADGMGGHAGGEVASRIAVETIAQALQTGSDLDKSILKANQAIKGAAQQSDGEKDMGTTIVALVMSGSRYKLAWVGDSRGYKINGGIEQVTTDHTLVQELLDQGIITTKEAEKHPKRNILTRALGIINDSIELVGTLDGKLEQADILLLCSDGLHGLICDNEILQAVARSKSPASAVKKLLKLALKAGGTDNISIIALSAYPWIGRTSNRISFGIRKLIDQLRITR